MELRPPIWWETRIEQWSRLLHAMYGDCFRGCVIFEPQKRGAIHAHGLIECPSKKVLTVPNSVLKRHEGTESYCKGWWHLREKPVRSALFIGMLSNLFFEGSCRVNLVDDRVATAISYCVKYLTKDNVELVFFGNWDDVDFAAFGDIEDTRDLLRVLNRPL